MMAVFSRMNRSFFLWVREKRATSGGNSHYQRGRLTGFPVPFRDETPYTMWHGLGGGTVGGAAGG